MAIDRFNVALDPIDSRAARQREQAQAQMEASMPPPDATPPAGAEPTPPPGEPAPPAEPGGGGGQGGSTPNPPPAPPAAPAGPHGNVNYNPTPGAPTAVQGVGASEATGGVQGSFGQAGTANFAERFGTQDNAPATWFRRNPAAMVGQGIGPDWMKRVAAQSGSAGGGGGTVGAPQASNPNVGGTQSDEDWQRFMQAVIQQRFRQ